MQLHTILRALAAACLLFFYADAVSAGQLRQPITISANQEKLDKVIKEIEDQGKVSFVYSRETLSRARPVTMEVKNEPLDNVLPILFRSQPLSYTTDGVYIIIRSAEHKKDTLPALPLLKGKILNEAGISVAGATVLVKGTSIATTSDSNGEFFLRDLAPGSVLLITGAEQEPVEIKAGNENFMTITLRTKVNELDQVLVTAYGETTRRLNTGNISKVTAAEISRQPVSNPLATLYGRVTGLDITQSSGLPGSNITIVIRGDNSIAQGSQPLFIVDGVPFMLNQGVGLGSINPSMILQNPLNSINPSDIESIEVLKDADATAIYGSQGANGVVMITTKKNKLNRTAFSMDYSTGIGTITRTLPMLNTQEFLAMRREAFANDSILPTPANAPDLFVWDTTKYTDWTEKLIGGQARTQNIQATLSGGNEFTQFLLSASYYSETTVFPKPRPSQRITGRAQVSHTSPNKKLTASVTASYSIDRKKLPTNDVTSFIFLAPNAPDLYDSTGKLSWIKELDNPLAYLERKYSSRNLTLMTNLNLSYRIASKTYVKLNAGYNAIDFDEQSATPISSQMPSPTSVITGTKRLGSIKVNSFILEPQVEHTHALGGGQLSFLAGLSFQQRKQTELNVTGSLYLNDDLLEVLSAAPRLTVTNRSTQYNYAAGFARINYNLKNRYIINLNARRDGSSRFGPANRFSNFGAVGAAWIFSDEAFLRNSTWLSFGKLRGSYGITGNDQMPDYLFLDLWTSSTAYQYQGQTGVLQQRLFNPYLQWERNKKMEFGIELGFFNNRVKLNTSYYRNRSDNQLVSVPLPTQTGFTSVQTNLDALVQNTGWEIEVNSRNISTRNFQWITQGNITIPKSKLVRYPGLALSPYRITYSEGEPLSTVKRYEYQGIDPQTGTYQVVDVNKDGILAPLDDYKKIGVSGPVFYGGVSQQFIYKSFQLDIFFQFKKQYGNSYLVSLGTSPGILSYIGSNQPRFVLDRWEHPGDISIVQKYTTSSTSKAARAYLTARSSSLMVANTSFIRLKNIALSWNIPMQKLKYCSLRWFINAQNLFTISDYKGVDPENQNLLSLPPLRIIATGVSLNF